MSAPHYKRLHLWTDGSMQNDKFGSAAIITTAEADDTAQVLLKVGGSQKHGCHSSTSAELFAILLGNSGNQ